MRQPCMWMIATIAVLVALAIVQTVGSQPGLLADDITLGAPLRLQHSARGAAAAWWAVSPLPGLSPLAYLPYVSRGALPEPQPQPRRLYLPLICR